MEDDGSVSVGDYDLVPLLDAFVEAHPDFSYHGRKGVLAMTGYEGVLGYRTDIAYKTRENLEPTQQEFLDSHPDFNYEEEVPGDSGCQRDEKERLGVCQSYLKPQKCDNLNGRRASDGQ